MEALICCNMAKGSLVRKLPSYGRMSRGSLLIMSKTQQFRVREQWGRRTLEERVHTQVKTLSCTNPFVFSGVVAPGVAKVSLFPWVRGSIWASCWQKVHRTGSESSMCTSTTLKTDSRGALLEDEGRQNAHQTAARPAFIIVLGGRRGKKNASLGVMSTPD